MVRCSKTSDVSAVVVGCAVGARLNRRGAGRGAQTTRWRTACKGMALVSALSVGGSVYALAADPPDPEANKAWGGCVLNPTAVTQLIKSIQDSSAPGTI